MDFLSLTLASSLGDGFWATIIGWFAGFITNYGWTIVVFTICLKLVLTPLDVFQKIITRKNTEKQAVLQPELAKLQKRYGNNKDILNQKTMELYKKNNYNVVTTCLGMVVNLVLTLVIFITLFSSLNSISQLKIKDEYQTLYSEYVTIIGTGATQEEAQEAVSERYGEIKEGWLWVKNVWRPDTYVSVFPSFDEYIKISGETYSQAIEGETYFYKDLNENTYTTEETAKEAAKEDFDIITAKIKENHTGWNGLLLLIVLAGVITFFSQKLAVKSFIPKKKEIIKNPEPAVPNPMGNNKIMSLVLTGLMVLFTWSYSAAFALYIVTNSVMTIILSLLINTILDVIKNKRENKGSLKSSRVQILQKEKK